MPVKATGELRNKTINQPKVLENVEVVKIGETGGLESISLLDESSSDHSNLSLVDDLELIPTNLVKTKSQEEKANRQSRNKGKDLSPAVKDKEGENQKQQVTYSLRSLDNLEPINEDEYESTYRSNIPSHRSDKPTRTR